MRQTYNTLSDFRSLQECDSLWHTRGFACLFLDKFPISHFNYSRCDVTYEVEYSNMKRPLRQNKNGEYTTKYIKKENYYVYINYIVSQFYLGANSIKQPRNNPYLQHFSRSLLLHHNGLRQEWNSTTFEICRPLFP